MDGSSQVFIEPMLKIGRTRLDAPRRTIQILKPIIVRDSAIVGIYFPPC